jgi:Domain of unknown function (DUF4932)
MLVLPAKRRLFLVGLICLSGFLNTAFAQTPALTPHVDERVELLSIVFRLAGNDEYNMNQLPAYSADIDHFFAPVKGHPAVQMARRLAHKDDDGVGFDAVMQMAVSLSPPPALKPLVEFTATTPDGRWGNDALKFLPLLRDFYRDSNFASFYAAHQSMYRLAKERFASLLGAVDLGWYARFYGKAPGLAYHRVLGMNNGGGNYGPRLSLPNRREELFSIIGCWTHDEVGNPTYPSDQGYLSTIIHEFNHSFVNPAVAEHWKDFSGVDQVYATVGTQLKKMAYGDSETMVNESLVRAGVIVYFQQRGESRRDNQRRIRQEQRNGFFWMDGLVEKLKQYQAERDQYPTFSSFMPQVAAFYHELATSASSAAADFDSKAAHVVTVQPFANHDQAVDASIRTITIIVDKPLDPEAGYSINKATDAGDDFPIAGKPKFGDAGLKILLPVELKPNQKYGFVLTPLGFTTADGYPLASYEVEFKTK